MVIDIRKVHNKMILLRLLLPILFIFTALSVPAGAITFVKLYEELPDYQENSPFIVTDSKQHNKLRAALAKTLPEKKQCNIGSVLVWKAPVSTDEPSKDWRVDLLTNVCNRAKHENIKNLIRSLAPSLNQSHMTFWISDSNLDKKPDLIVGYIDISKDEVQYPYLSLWRLKYEKGIFKARYAGPFLNGTLHNINSFGTESDRNCFFVKHASCIECEPIIYLTAIDFEASSGAQFYEFSYSEKHDGFNPTIEYELPGMGHTVEATVETRLLPPSENGPHLLQFFDMAEGPDEWWMFTCKDYKCDYKMFKNEPSNDFKDFWKKASPI